PPFPLLLIEPNDDSRLIFSAALRHCGYAVTESRDWAEAAALARACTPALVVLGVSFPQQDAWAALQALKSAPATADIPVLAVSSSAFPADRARAMELGCADFLAKPCPPAQLMAAARRHLPG
ncbi:MAG TPA: response regulator, partial [Longimicrobium sp.]|nr:response regulator [Longimicrobium sp.]